MVALLILKEVFTFVQKTRASARGVECEDATAKLAGIEDKMNSLVSSTASMASVMEKSDSSGLPLIYRDGSLTQAIATLSSSIASLTDKVNRL